MTSDEANNTGAPKADTPDGTDWESHNVDELARKGKEDLANRDKELNSEAVDLADTMRRAHPSPDPLSTAMQKPVGSPAFLTALVKWHPAIGCFQFLADCTNPSSDAPDIRFNQALERWPRLFWFCIIVDKIVMLAVLAGLGIIASRVIYLTLFA
ncbi:Uncharacterised protein [Corynebacterium renale]|uniref:Uncharacterized protein n=1 Tax=Corynebacterium renale TaxID=1724 RepID=A0A2A9DNF4_9CORY|nr:hypothetical protein ATK06_0487 [Corynebacterium renale]SQI23408.1 Uncharacterised protein [Corynebacterium renale]